MIYLKLKLKSERQQKKVKYVLAIKNELKNTEKKKLEKLIKALAPKQQEYIKCRYFDELSVKEIAEIYKVNPSTVSRTIKIGIDHMSYFIENVEVKNMRKKPVEKRCKCCGEIFLTTASNAKYCIDCRYENKKRTTQKWRDGTKLSVKKQKFKDEFHSKSLDETLADIKAYNEKHGTRLSYGKYMTLLHFGKLED